jgi:VWFA-related protein
MPSHLAAVLATVCLALAAAPAAIQETPAERPVPSSSDIEPASPPAPAFRSTTDLVVLHVSVLGRGRGFVSDLPDTAFAVFEDGRPQPVSLFLEQDTPVTVGLLIDNSISMRQNTDLVIAGAIEFARAGHERDDVFALVFNESVRSALPQSAPFTSNPAVLGAALTRAIVARGRTAFFDAVIEGLAYADRGEHARQVLVIIGDGGDNESRVTFDDMLRRAQASNAMIYTVSLVDPLDREAKPERMEQLAAATGGAAFRPRSRHEVSGVLERVAADIRQTYTIGYTSDRPADDTFRRVRVVVTPPDRSQVTVRTRTGYLAQTLKPSQKVPPERRDAEH